MIRAIETDPPQVDTVEIEEGGPCRYCKGTYQITRIHDCLCHILRAPCSGCTDAPLICDTCGDEGETK